MKEIVWLNLPAVPEDLEQQLIVRCQQVNIQLEKIDWMNQFHQHSVPIAAQEYGNENTVIPKELLAQLTDFYSNYFFGAILPIIGRTKNMLNESSVTPPHADSKRYVAVNYLLANGGSNVTTSFYHQHRATAELDRSENIRYDQVTLMSSYILPERRWHAFNAQRFHSVENIETERYLFSLMIELNPTFEEFLQQYRSLIIDC